MRIIKLTVLFAVLFISGSFAQQPVQATPQWRPQYHFTSPANWINDPNGLIFLNGEYHLYFQHNPFENKWGHMSWGHASSKDLIRWKHLPVAIPEVISNDTVTWIYSGSAVLDVNNTSGFGEKCKAPVVAMFTADQPNQKKESQFIAYSNDNGLSYKFYSGNPVIDLNKKDFRDPNVFWHEGSGQWVMTVAMVDEHMVRIYGSKNLKEWTKLNDFGPAGYTRNGWECPSLLPLMVDNDPKHLKWVMFVSCFGDHGPMMQYYIGDFDGVNFKNDHPAEQMLKVDDGDTFYAAMAWRDAPENRKILLGWLMPGKKETYPWKGQMSIPRDLSIKSTPEGLRLIQNPSNVLSSSLAGLAKGRVFTKTNLPLENKQLMLSKAGSYDGNSWWIDVAFQIGSSKNTGIRLAEKAGSDKKIVVGYDAIKQELYVDCSGSEKANKSPENLRLTAALKPLDGVVKMKILLDKSSLEVFGNSGERVISTLVYPESDATQVSLFSEGKAIVKSLKMWDLSGK